MGRGGGYVLTEWRFPIAVPGEPRRPLVPDVAFVRYDRRCDLSEDDVQVPPFAPDVAVEILSVGDRALDLETNRRLSARRWTTRAVVDPKRRTIRAVDSETDRTLSSAETFAHAAVPGFTLNVGPFFESVLHSPF